MSIKQDFDFLLNNENIGIYNAFELIEIFGIDTKTNDYFNIFTLVVAEYSELKKETKFLTDKLQKFKNIKDKKWGIKTSYLKKDEIKLFFNSLKNENTFQINKENSISIGSINFLNKQFIEKSETLNNIQLNNILKNNFHNGSYILEGFDVSKINLEFLLNNPITLNEFSEAINQFIPIKIGTISDRLGNIIFQFPINLFKVKESFTRDNKIKFDFQFNNKISRTISLQVIAKSSHDNVIMDFNTKVIENNDSIKIDTDNVMEYYLLDSKTGLLLYKNKMSTIKEINLNMGLINPQSRFFKLDGKTIEVNINSNMNSIIGEREKLQYTDWINGRIYENERVELEKSKSFIQYFGKLGDRDRALEDIRSLINTYGNQGVYLWDPYLCVDDIKNTLYFCTSSNVPLKAITDLPLNQYSDMQNQFKEDDIDFLLLNLEVRGKTGNYGYKFHDRFIIFPTDKPKVWSLGISINQLGQSHHILQEIQNAQHILNAFNELWQQLNHQECLIWKTT